MVIFTTDYLMRDGKDHRLLAQARFLGRGLLRGYSIFRLPPINAPILSPHRGGECWGEAFAIPPVHEDWMLSDLDDYHAAAGFARTKVQVTVDGFALNCEAYVGVAPPHWETGANWLNRYSLSKPDRRRYARP